MLVWWLSRRKTEGIKCLEVKFVKVRKVSKTSKEKVIVKNLCHNKDFIF